MLERDVESRYVRFVKSYGKGGRAVKFKSRMQRHVPDRLIFVGKGHIYFMELKATGKEATEGQAMFHDVMREYGATVYVCDDAEEAKEIHKKEYHKVFPEKVSGKSNKKVCK